MINNYRAIGACFLQAGLLVTASGAFGKAPSTAPSERYAPVELRGYGTVAGAVWNQASGSVLEIDCQDADKAKLLQAKYLSDLQVLPGVKENVENNLTSYSIDGQGSIAAFQDGAKVVIFSATTSENLDSLSRQNQPLGESTAQVDVPMWLDRWDKFNFRHYYWPWQLPKGQTDATYDFTHEFDYAQQMNRAGILLGGGPLATDSADGMWNSGFANWVAEEASKRNLPVDLHFAANASSEPTWFLNRYREQTQLKMPGFTGNFHSLMSPELGAQGVLSWSATTAEDDRLSLLQQQYRRLVASPNVTSILEPHGELKHGNQDIFLEYGPVADAGYRRYLQGKYRTLEALADRWGVRLNSWDEVRVPEIASFAGWGPAALDIGGLWRVGYEELAAPMPADYNWSAALTTPKSNPAPEDWFKPDFNDASWPQIPGAGHDHQLFLPKRPSVFRRSFEVPAEWKARQQRVWLYVWDMNLATNEEVRVVLNGTEVGRSRVQFIRPHWSAIEVTSTLLSGRNTLALRLPQGYIAYKSYLSPVKPKEYPDLGEHLNGQWVDFIDFTAWSRIQTVRRGIEAIRQVAPNQGITLMAPYPYADGVKSLAAAFGGEFRDTGFMGVAYADVLPSLMRGANLPFSLEPGGPATDLADFKKQIGLYQTEGVQAIDYFIHIGSILWNPEIKAEYEKQRKQLSLLGQSHSAKAEVAILYSDRIAELTGYPWGSSYNTNLGGGYWHWNAGAVLRGSFPYDALSQSSFASGDANAYRLIVDSNTSIVDQALVNDIEKWVRAGGTFITLAQTGRHTPENPDSWPVASLTGYHVLRIDRIKSDGSVEESGTLKPAPGQPVFDAAWDSVQANGLHLKKVASDAQDLLLWNDGTVAAGVRPLGRGFIVQLGAKFTGAKIFDRVEPGQNSPETKLLRQLLTAVLDWKGVKHEPCELSPANEQVWARPGVTNNGLYDTWTLRNWSKDTSQTVSLLLTTAKPPTFAIDARDGKPYPITKSAKGARLDRIVLDPLEARAFLTPRGRIAEAPTAWFDLQRNWWRGTTKPDPKPLPAPVQRLAYELTADWKFETLDEGEDATALLGTQVDDQSWPSRDLGIWDVKDAGGKRRAVFRKTFTVPASWGDGKVSLWMTSWAGSSFVEKGRVWLDGVEVKPMDEREYIAIGMAALAPGSTHTLAVEAQSRGVLAGLRGQCWLSVEPRPQESIDLAGEWLPSVDGLNYTAPVTLPGQFKTQFLKRTVLIVSKYRGLKAVITIDGDPALISVLINGKLVRRHHHMVGQRGSLNLTPFVRFGESNEIELVRWGQFDTNSAPGRTTPMHTVKELVLGFYPADPS